jgi:hypothetical protein
LCIQAHQLVEDVEEAVGGEVGVVVETHFHLLPTDVLITIMTQVVVLLCRLVILGRAGKALMIHVILRMRCMLIADMTEV